MTPTDVTKKIPTPPADRDEEGNQIFDIVPGAHGEDRTSHPESIKKLPLL